MNDRDQINAFAEELNNLISRYSQEFQLTNAAAIGVLAIKQYEMIRDARGDDEPNFNL